MLCQSDHQSAGKIPDLKPVHGQEHSHDSEEIKSNPFSFSFQFPAAKFNIFSATQLQWLQLDTFRSPERDEPL